MKRSYISFPVLLIVAFVGLVAISCNKTDLPVTCDGSTPTYDGTVKAIIDANCTSSSCHGSGSSRGDYTSYSSLEGDLTNGKFTSEVLVNGSMPQGSSLSTAELVTLQCWADNNFAEN